jgi:uncharacterized glyoxalase superfamily protein PhnB
MTLKKMTPVLFTEEVEPCVKFWVERAGFEKTVEVPDANKLAFAILKKGDIELMYQSYASGAKDVPGTASLQRQGVTFLFIEVDNLGEIIQAMKGAEIVIPERTTFYGSREIGIKDPAGHIATFAQFGAAAAH